MDGRMKGQTDPGALMGGHVNEWHDRAGRWIDGWARRGLSDVPSVENLKSYF